MSNDLTARKNAAEATLSRICGADVELTIRGETKFTVSTEEVTRGIGDKLRKYFGALATITEAHDDECGSFYYIDAAA